MFIIITLKKFVCWRYGVVVDEDLVFQHGGEGFKFS